MIVTAWNNGQHKKSGAGYGVRVAVSDVPLFEDEWETVILELDGDPAPVEVNIRKRSFRSGRCGELIHQRIGRWLWAHGLATWPPRQNPRFEVEPIGERRFPLQLPAGIATQCRM